MEEILNIKEYLEIFKRRKFIILFILIVCISRGAYITYQRNKSYVPVYQSTVSLRINNMKSYKPPKDEEEAQNQSIYMNSLSNSNLNQNIASSYYSLATSKRALLEVVKSLGLDITPESLAGSITVTPQEEIPEFIDITVTNLDGQLAQKIAHAIPEAFNNELIRVIGLDCVEILFDASEPITVGRTYDKSVYKYGTIGIVISIFIVLLLEVLDDKVITPDDVEKYWGVPMIGMIPYDNGHSKGKIKRNKSKNIEISEI